MYVLLEGIVLSRADRKNKWIVWSFNFRGQSKSNFHCSLYISINVSFEVLKVLWILKY